MQTALLICLVFVPLLAIVGLIVLVRKHRKNPAPKSLVAETNHKSVRSFHYEVGGAAKPAAPVAAPPIAANNPLARLMGEKDYRAQQDQEEQDLQAEADRLEAEQMEARELAASAVAETPAEPVVVTEPAESDVATPGPLPASSTGRSVLDMVGLNTPKAAPDALAESQEVRPVTPVADEEDDTVAESLYDNPLTAAAPTANDTANRLTAVQLKQKQRAALAAKSTNQKAALTALYPGK
jgi:hypothetical protein